MTNTDFDLVLQQSGCELRLTVSRRGPNDVLTVAGDLNVLSAWQLREWSTTRPLTERIDIDLTSVGTLDTAGVAAVTLVARRLRAGGHRVAVLAPIEAQAAEIAAMTGVLDLV